MTDAITSWAERVGLPRNQCSVISMLESVAAERPHKPCFSDHTGDRVTYSELIDRSRRLAAGLQCLGVKQGDVAVLYLENSINAVISMLALGYLGAAGAPINTDYKGDLLAYVVNDTGASLAIVDAVLLGQFATVADRYINFGQQGGASVVIHGQHVGDTNALRTVNFTAVASADPIVEYVATTQSDLFMVNYTSGTTGPSKGVLFPNGQVLTFGYDWVMCMNFTENDTIYTPMPLFHTLGLILGIIPTLMMGASLFLDRRFSASQYWARAKENGATVGHAVFSMIPFLLRQEPSDLDRSHGLTRIWTGPSRYAKAFKERFGVNVFEVYGQSEVGVITLPDVWEEVRPGSCGRANKRFDIRIVDRQDNPLPPGAAGEVVVRPKEPYTTMLGYLNKPEKTAEASRNLWHHSGDHMYVDADGWYFFVDRAKDMIRRRSQNISAYDIELIINAHPLIAEIAVIAVPSEHEDDEIKLCVSLSRGQFEIETFIAFCRENLPRHMVPRYIEVLPSLPKTPNEKIAKYKLRELGIRGSTGVVFDTEHGSYI